MLVRSAATPPPPGAAAVHIAHGRVPPAGHLLQPFRLRWRILGPRALSRRRCSDGNLAARTTTSTTTCRRGPLQEGGDRSGIEIHYKRLIDEDPCNGLFLRNYARFLYQYAKLVWEAHGDEERASSYFDRAARADPHNSHVLAAFLWDTDHGAGPQDDDAMTYTGFPAAHPSMASATS